MMDQVNAEKPRATYDELHKLCEVIYFKFFSTPSMGLSKFIKDLESSNKHNGIFKSTQEL